MQVLNILGTNSVDNSTNFYDDSIYPCPTNNKQIVIAVWLKGKCEEILVACVTMAVPWKNVLAVAMFRGG